MKHDLFRDLPETLEQFDCRLSVPSVSDEEVFGAVVYESVPNGCYGCHTPTRYQQDNSTLRVLIPDADRCCAILYRDKHRCFRPRTRTSDYCTHHWLEFQELRGLVKERALRIARKLGVAR